MVSVTQRISAIKQPRGGYVKPSRFEVTQLPIGEELAPAENIHSSLVGLAVDYLTRFTLGTRAEEAFRISLYGAQMIDELEHAWELLESIIGLDSYSITCACQLVGYDVVFRAGRSGYKPVESIVPDMWTIENIRIMVERSLVFFNHYGPVIKDGFNMLGGYTETIDSGDGDFLTSDTLWDFKVSKAKPTAKHTLQVLVYYLMGLQSDDDHFKQLLYLGIYNPRLHHVYRLRIDSVDGETIDTVCREVIGYSV
ncbi:hypothetical protein ACVRZR_04810 [Streptococcus entericus]|uniref:hypothetical protein n=1 Tax=Streptococcus entericus TaxID=155680 RepID=UPI0003A261A2|nr:hypothetical protein [Streptococcus entericus]